MSVNFKRVVSMIRLAQLWGMAQRIFHYFYAVISPDKQNRYCKERNSVGSLFFGVTGEIVLF